jgi:Fe2+ or Zn2+ uptake regulation protein
LDEEARKMGSFFGAEELHTRATKQAKGPGLATVYRYLNAEEKQGKLHSYECNRRKVYSLDYRSHCHYTCEKCKKAKHLKIRKLNFLKDNITGSICHFQIDVTGLCKDCSRISKKKLLPKKGFAI